MSREIEEWRPVVGYEGGYEVSDWGRVRSLKYKRKRILYQYPSTAIYYLVALSKNGKVRRYGVHRLVAEAWIPNPQNKPQVDHINGCKTDNYVWNLRWTTQSENLRNPVTYIKFFKPLSEEVKKKISALAKQRIRIDSKFVDQIDLKTGEVIETYKTIAEAARQTGYSDSNIRACSKGKRNSCKGYGWKTYVREG